MSQEAKSVDIPKADTHPSKWQVAWAAATAIALQVLAEAPQITQYLLPFVPPGKREKLLSAGALAAVVAGILLNRKATSNLAGFTLPVVQAVKPVAEAVQAGEAPVVVTVPVAAAETAGDAAARIQARLAAEREGEQEPEA
jgi:hypothetical protein